MAQRVERERGRESEDTNKERIGSSNIQGSGAAAVLSINC